MALIEVHHTIATSYPVSPDHDVTANPIIEGEFVALSATGFVTQTGVVGGAMGIAGDSLANDSGYTPYAADIIVNSAGGTRSTSNRVSDFFNETLASGKITVYTGVGEFYTDRYVPGATWTPGLACYTTAAGLLTTADPGSGRVVGKVIAAPQAYPSGVPGVDVEGSISLGNFVRFALSL